MNLDDAENVDRDTHIQRTDNNANENISTSR
jgi:hypothetical protein